MKRENYIRYHNITYKLIFWALYIYLPKDILILKHFMFTTDNCLTSDARDLVCIRRRCSELKYKDEHFPLCFASYYQCFWWEDSFIWYLYFDDTVVIAFSGDSGFCVLCSQGSGEWSGLPCVGMWRGAVGGRHYNHWASIRTAI